MKITRRQLRRLINEVYKDYESQKQGERARLNIPGLQSKLSSIESSGKYADEVQANQLALGMGSKELELPQEQLKINLEFEMIKNKARAYLQSILDYCDWINSSDERFTPEDKETIKQMNKKSFDLSQEYYRSIPRLLRKLAKHRQFDANGFIIIGNPEQHEFYMKLSDYSIRPFDDHGSLLADIAREEPKYAWLGRPVKPGMCQDMYNYRNFGPIPRF